ncbi:MAG TPA: uracil phosphoribosyltransferase [Candidatus Dormibacteraeota bacterium]|nr:uracil phosphoribosyltransferase [Candidatus Dormibacteraeota bacterium]
MWPSTLCGGSSRATHVPLHVSRHPLVADSLRGLRDSTTEPEEFRILARNVITLLLYEATADLPVKHGKVRTPLADAEAIEVASEVVAIPVLRAGLGLLGPVLELLPRVSVGYIGLERDEDTAVARIYYNKLPRLQGKIPLLLDPMLATGGSAAQALDMIKEAGGRNTRMVCVVAAPEGVKVLAERHPEVDVYAAALDDHLNDRAYIVPGLGDFGDRLFGTGS